jgi:hypothetical protein
MKKLVILCLIAVLTTLCHVNLTAADKPTPAENGEKKGPKHAPFRGKIDGLDKAARTVKVGGRTFHLTTTTKVTKDEKPAAFDDVTVGEQVRGAYHAGEGGKLELLSLYVGGKLAKEEKKEETK